MNWHRLYQDEIHISVIWSGHWRNKNIVTKLPGIGNGDHLINSLHCHIIALDYGIERFEME